LPKIEYTVTHYMCVQRSMTTSIQTASMDLDNIKINKLKVIQFQYDLVVSKLPRSSQFLFVKARLVPNSLARSKVLLLV